jgi:chromosome segregation ATPase
LFGKARRLEGEIDSLRVALAEARAALAEAQSQNDQLRNDLKWTRDDLRQAENQHLLDEELADVLSKEMHKRDANYLELESEYVKQLHEHVLRQRKAWHEGLVEGLDGAPENDYTKEMTEKRDQVDSLWLKDAQAALEETRRKANSHSPATPSSPAFEKPAE